MIQQTEAEGVQQWDGLVAKALAASGVDGTVLLGDCLHPVAVPFGLPALMSAVLHFVAPEPPRRLRVYTYDVLDIGCLLEIRGARELGALPATLVDLAAELGVRLNFSRLPGSCSVLLTLPR